VSLRRVGFASLLLGDLPAGQWRSLSEAELEKLKKLAFRPEPDRHSGGSAGVGSHFSR